MIPEATSDGLSLAGKQLVRLDERVTVRVPAHLWAIVALIAIIVGSNQTTLREVVAIGAHRASAEIASNYGPGEAVNVMPGNVPVLPYPIPELLPGETFERVFTVTQRGTTDATLSIHFVPRALTSSGPVGDHKLQVEIARCSGEWALKNGSDGGATYECDNGAGLSSERSTGTREEAGRTWRSDAVSPGESIIVAPRVAPGEPISVRLRATAVLGDRAPKARLSASIHDRGQIASLEWHATAIPLFDRSRDASTGRDDVSVQFDVPLTSRQEALPGTARETARPANDPPQVVPHANPPKNDMTVPLTQKASRYAVALDGIDDAVELRGAPVSVATKEEWTVEAWVCPTAFDGAQAIYTENVSFASGAGGMVFGLGLIDRQIVVGSLADGTPNRWAWTVATIPEGIQPRTWMHVAATRAGASVALFINGEEAAPSVPSSGPWPSIESNNPSTFYIGRAANPDAVSPFRGEIDDVRVWTRARTAHEVHRGRRQRLSGLETGLASAFTMAVSGDSSTVGSDSAMVNLVTGAHTGRLVGGANPILSGADIVLPPTPFDLGLESSDRAGVIGDPDTNSSAMWVAGRPEPMSEVTVQRNGTDITPMMMFPTDGRFSVELDTPLTDKESVTATAANRDGLMELRSTPFVVRGEPPK